MKWEDVRDVIKWTLANAKYLEPDDLYLIEKEVDKCHIAMQQRLKNTPLNGDHGHSEPCATGRCKHGNIPGFCKECK